MRLISLFAIFLCTCLQPHLLGLEIDYDYAVVGTSPIAIFEALYHSYKGERVLMLERNSTLGGSWQTIDICNLQNIDMGCHQLGDERKIKDFLEQKIGCRCVRMSDPYNRGEELETSDKGFYFSGGCHELLSRLQELLSKSQIHLLFDHPLESVALNIDQKIVEIKTRGQIFRVSKMIITPRSQITIENYTSFPKMRTTKLNHLYLLIKDPSPVKFTYLNGFCKGISRVSNLTPFSKQLQGTGCQLIAIQSYDANPVERIPEYLVMFKKKGWLDDEASLETFDSFLYEQKQFTPALFAKNCQDIYPFFEILYTDHFVDILAYLDKWEEAFTIDP